MELFTSLCNGKLEKQITQYTFNFLLLKSVLHLIVRTYKSSLHRENDSENFTTKPTNLKDKNHRKSNLKSVVRPTTIQPVRIRTCGLSYKPVLYIYLIYLRYSNEFRVKPLCDISEILWVRPLSCDIFRDIPIFSVDVTEKLHSRPSSILSPRRDIQHCCKPICRCLGTHMALLTCFCMILFVDDCCCLLVDLFFLHSSRQAENQNFDLPQSLTWLVNEWFMRVFVLCPLLSFITLTWAKSLISTIKI